MESSRTETRTMSKQNIVLVANDRSKQKKAEIQINWKLVRNVVLLGLIIGYAVWLQVPSDENDEDDDVIWDFCGYDPVSGTPRDSMFPEYHVESATVARGEAARIRFRQRFSFLWKELIGTPSSYLCMLSSYYM